MGNTLASSHLAEACKGSETFGAILISALEAIGVRCEQSQRSSALLTEGCVSCNLIHRDMIDKKTERVLREILGHERPYDVAGEEITHVHLPGFQQLKGLASILADPRKREKHLHAFFAKHPEFLLGFVPRSTGSILACLSKPPIGAQHRNADFVILTAGQSGASTQIFELEQSGARMFTKDLTPGKEFRKAIGQVHDWQQWIGDHGQTFIDDMLRLACKAPQYPDRSAAGSFRLMDCEQLRRYWDGFGSRTDPYPRYTIVIGRWARLSEVERQRVRLLNQNGPQIITYDQVARSAYHRPYRSIQD